MEEKYTTEDEAVEPIEVVETKPINRGKPFSKSVGLMLVGAMAMSGFVGMGSMRGCRRFREEKEFGSIDEEKIRKAQEKRDRKAQKKCRTLVK